MQWARGKYSSVVSAGIIGFIAFVFVVSGVFSPKATRGLHEGSVAGTVNGDPISLTDFNRALNQRMEFFKNIGGGKLTDDQLKAFHIREGVFEELVRKKLMEQEATKQGLEASDEEVMDRIREIPAFQKDGKFDVTTYKATLESNNYTAGTFERMVRTDLSAQAWQSYFQSRIKVSDAELRAQYAQNEDKRDIKYVLLNAETGKAGVKVEQSDVDKFLADTSKVNLAKSQYEAKKTAEFKNLTFDMVKAQIAREILSSDKIGEIKAINEKLADQVQALMTADKSSDAKINALLKPYKVDVKSTGLVASDSKLPGDSTELVKDAFAAKSPIDPAQGGKAHKYVTPATVLVAIVTQVKKPDVSKLDTDAAARIALIKQLSNKKQRDIYDEWLKRIQAKAKIDPNPQVVQGESS
jgi:peptidyl-prolyl cis-trans isomerase D